MGNIKYPPNHRKTGYALLTNLEKINNGYIFQAKHFPRHYCAFFISYIASLLTNKIPN